VIDDFDRCYRAAKSKDARFDGWFFTAVTSTGIYCRPSCPAMTPKPSNVRFYVTAAAAQHAGFRACKRCRPDAAPGSPEWDARADIVARAMRLIAGGVIDRSGVPGLARELGYSTRQIERLLLTEVGATPLALARAQRAQAARVLIETTALSMAQISFAAGFSSIRQFNDTIRSVFAMTPTELRHHAVRRARGVVPAQKGAAAQRINLRLPFRQPFCPDNLFGHLAATAVPGCEEVVAGTYRRTLRLPHGAGVVELRPEPDHIDCALHVADLRDLTPAISRCRRLLDLDADPVAVDDVLRADKTLRPLLDAAPGRRVPRTVDEDEMAVRAVLGQQVSTAAARVHAARLVAAHGTALDDIGGGLTHLFPSADQLLDVDPATLAMPMARRRTFIGLVAALADGTIRLGPGADREQARMRMAEVPGMGPWTIELVAMRAMGDPDAFVGTDLGIRRAARALGLAPTQRAFIEHAAQWRPWRSYAVQYLWSVLDHPINRMPGIEPAPPEAPGDARTAAPGGARPTTDKKEKEVA
jgi:AraC family transcriptional regulator of adaptative response / DNA-3-methyladenine glycosylase II